VKSESSPGVHNEVKHLYEYCIIFSFCDSFEGINTITDVPHHARSTVTHHMLHVYIVIRFRSLSEALGVKRRLLKLASIRGDNVFSILFSFLYLLGDNLIHVVRIPGDSAAAPEPQELIAGDNRRTRAIWREQLEGDILNLRSH
jgi:hypothetical protein